MTNPQSDYPDFIQPSAAVYTQLFDGDLTGGGEQIQCGQFSSVHVQLYNTDGVSVKSAKYWFSPTTPPFAVVDAGLLSCNSVAVGDGRPSWTLPVVADQLTLDGLDTGTRATVLGVSKIVPKRLGADLQPIRLFQGTLAANAPAGTTVNLASVGTLGVDYQVQDCSEYNGQIMMQWRSTVGITGDGFVRWVDGSGAEQTLITFQNFSTTLARLLTGHPYGFVKWKFVSNALNGAAPSVLTLALIPATAAL